MANENFKRLYIELCKEEQKLMKEMIRGTILPDTDAPIQKRIDVIEEEIDKIKEKVSPDTIDEWLSQLHGE